MSLAFSVPSPASTLVPDLRDPVNKKGEVAGDVCLVCAEKITIGTMRAKINLLIMKASKYNLNQLRERLFECLEEVKAKRMTIAEAKAACQVAQTIINSVRLEMDFIKLSGGPKKSEFFLTDVEETTQ